MQIQDILSQECTHSAVDCGSKKKVLEKISYLAARALPSLDHEKVFDKLLAREKLGSTGIGHGIAIPHCRIANCTDSIGFLVQLRNGIDFDAIDNQKVDLLFILLVPEQAHADHLQMLSLLAEKFSQAKYRAHLREARTDQELYLAATSS